MHLRGKEHGISVWIIFSVELDVFDGRNDEGRSVGKRDAKKAALNRAPWGPD